MASIVDLSDLINLQSGGNNGNPENIFFHKVGRIAGATATTPVAGRGCSLWRYDGMPAGGAIPGAGEIPTNLTTGSISFTQPGSGRDKHLIHASITPVVAGVYLLYDRLYHIGGLSGTSAVTQSIQGAHPGSPALTRNTNGNGNIVFYEIYAAVGTTARTLSMTYTNQNGTTGRSANINIGAAGFSEITRMQRIPLAAGDTGVQSVQDIVLNGTTGTAGSFGITIAHPLAWIPVGAAGVMGWRDYTTGLPGIPTIHPSASLALLFIPAVATVTEVLGCLGTVEK